MPLFRYASYKLRFVGPLLGPTLRNLGSARFRRFMVDMFPWKGLHEMRDIIDVMNRTSTKIYKDKMQTLKEGDMSAKLGLERDLISILCELGSIFLSCFVLMSLFLPVRANMAAPKDESMTEEEVLGQISYAGYS